MKVLLDCHVFATSPGRRAGTVRFQWRLRRAARRWRAGETSLAKLSGACESPVGGGGVRKRTFYGETCIPSGYVARVWRPLFARTEFIAAAAHQRFDQNVVVAVK